jgi:hypothetical protein
MHVGEASGPDAPVAQATSRPVTAGMTPNAGTGVPAHSLTDSRCALALPSAACSNRPAGRRDGPIRLASGTRVQVYREVVTEQTPGPDLAPQACTLPTAQQPLRLAEIDTLFTNAVRNGERVTDTHLRLALTGGSDLEATVRDLAERESDCCSFFTFRISAHAPGQVTLDIEVPPAHADVLSALGQRADAIHDG